MPLSRRSAMAGFATIIPSTAIFTRSALAQSVPTQPAPTLPGDTVPERGMGKADAKLVVQEWFSLTCSHCAEFQKVTFPQVKANLIDTGRIRYIWRDYPLDQVALMAAMVARSLPAERYEPFISTLLATQDRWAFARGVNSMEELAKYAALAGMPRASFDAALNNTDMKRDILAAQAGAEKDNGINSTPSFLFNRRMVAGAMQYPAFQQAVDAEPAG